MEGRNPRTGDDRLEVDPLNDPEVVRLVPWMWRHAKKVVVAIVGGTVVLIGLALLVLPGPGLLTIILGLAILATQFAFAARWLRMARERAKSIATYAQMQRVKQPDEPRPPDVNR